MPGRRRARPDQVAAPLPAAARWPVISSAEGHILGPILGHVAAQRARIIQ